MNDSDSGEGQFSELPLGFRLTNYHSTENFGWKFMGGSLGLGSLVERLNDLLAVSCLNILGSQKIFQGFYFIFFSSPVALYRAVKLRNRCLFGWHNQCCSPGEQLY